MHDPESVLCSSRPNKQFCNMVRTKFILAFYIYPTLMELKICVDSWVLCYDYNEWKHTLDRSNTGNWALCSVIDRCSHLHEQQKLLIDGTGFITFIPRRVKIVTWVAHHFGDYFCRNFKRCDDNENILNGTTCCHGDQRNLPVQCILHGTECVRKHITPSHLLLQLVTPLLFETALRNCISLQEPRQNS